MPLPAALLAKLTKRGIIQTPTNEKEKETSTENVVPGEIQEEIIAEDYDDAPQVVPEAPIVVAPPPPPETFEKFQGWYACPNKWNVYHECTTGCRERWKTPKEVDPDYNKNRLKLLKKYPILSHWEEVLEHGVGRYYYWNTDTDFVSWYPPGHSKCQVSRSAANLRKFMIEERESNAYSEKEQSSSEEEDDELGNQITKIEKDDESSDSSDDSIDEPIAKDKFSSKKTRAMKDTSNAKELKDDDRKSVKKIKKEPELDPMDPAAYSECPRGNWASGLPERNEARTGVDTTATGPLFQMRPYPNPGAVLRANHGDGILGPKKIIPKKEKEDK